MSAAPFENLYGIYENYPAIIIGGGPSAPLQYLKCPKVAVRISVNQHGCIMDKCKCDYIVAIDRILDKPLPIGGGKTAKLTKFCVPILSPHAVADGDFLLARQPVEHNGAIVAAHCAYKMGCNPVIIIGIDCYTGDGVYFHTPDAKSSGTVQHISHHINRWKSFARKVPDANIKIIGGPLEGTFHKYER